MDRVAFLDAMKAQIAVLERELAHDPRRKQLAALRNALATFNGEVKPSVAASSAFAVEDPVNKEIRALLKGRDWTHKKIILKNLMESGIPFDAEDPKKALGKRLFRMADVEGDKKGNYRLKRDSKESRGPNR